MAGAQSWGAENVAPAGAGYDLRPLSTGEVLDRTFLLYRSHFALFASLAAVPAAINFITGIIQLLLINPTLTTTRHSQHVMVSRVPLVSAGVTILSVLIYFVFYGIMQAATTWAVSELYLGRPASIGSAWRTATARWLRYVLVTLRQYWSIAWAPMLAFLLFLIPAALVSRRIGITAALLAFFFGLLLLITCVYAVIAAIRVSLAIPASVIESLGANAAVRRSMDLLAQRKFRIFLLGLLLVAISLVLGIALSPLTFLALRAHGAERYLLQMLQLSGGFLGGLLIGPVAAIALCLFYFDERVRHEGFDIEFLMQRAGGSAPGNPLAEGTTSPEPA